MADIPKQEEQMQKIIKTQKSGITMEDLMQFDEDEWIEIVNGEIVKKEMSAGFLHVHVITNLYDILKPYVQKHKLGMVLTDGVTYVLQERENDINITRIPDLSFVSKEKIAQQDVWEKPFKGAPDLAVEVASPQQTVASLHERITDYLEHGTQQVWVLIPQTKQIYQYIHDQPDNVRLYHENDTLTADLFPDLEIAVNAVFALPDMD